jgi:hypothetical protein
MIHPRLVWPLLHTTVLNTAVTALREGSARGCVDGLVRCHLAGSVLHTSACVSGPPDDRCSIQHSNPRHRADTEFTFTSNQGTLACAAGAQVRVGPCTGGQCWGGKQQPEQQHTVCALHAQALCSHCDRSAAGTAAGHAVWTHLWIHTPPHPPCVYAPACSRQKVRKLKCQKTCTTGLPAPPGRPQDQRPKLWPGRLPLPFCSPYKADSFRYCSSTERYRRPLSLRYAVSMMSSMASTWWCVMVHVLAMRFFCSGSQAPPCSRLSISA